jgi:hypothetical protein
MFVSCVICCVVLCRYRPLQRADHSFREVLTCVQLCAIRKSQHRGGQVSST